MENKQRAFLIFSEIDTKEKLKALAEKEIRGERTMEEIHKILYRKYARLVSQQEDTLPKKRR